MVSGASNICGSTGGTDITAEELKTNYIIPYMEAFPDTLLVNPWGKTMYDEVYEWCIDNGVTIRRDGMMKLENGKEIFEYAYGKLPTIFEYYDGYTTLKSNDLWDTDYLLELVEEWGASYTEFFGQMYDENTEFCNMLVNKLGYYFRLKEAKYPNTVTTSEETTISFNFENDGVTPIYEECIIYIGLLDENYDLVSKYKTDIDASNWLPDEISTETVNITFSDIDTGKYIIAVGLFQNEDDESPTYLLGNTGGTDNNWYVFGNITITNE